MALILAWKAKGEHHRPIDLPSGSLVGELNLLNYNYTITVFIYAFYFPPQNQFKKIRFNVFYKIKNNSKRTRLGVKLS